MASGWLKAPAQSNIFAMSSRFLALKQSSCWLNNLNAAPQNMPCTSVAVSNESGWLHAAASLNMRRIMATLLVAKASGWLNAAALKNMQATLVTLLVFHCSLNPTLLN